MESTREERFAGLVARSMKRLSSIARCYARGDERKDLLQEILLQVWRSLDRFEGRSSLDTWAYRVALNTAIVWRRKDRARFADAHRAIEADEPVGASDSRNEVAILDEYIETLGPAERSLFVLYLEDLSYQQIAEVLGLTENHVGVKIHRLKKAFIERYLK